MSKHLIAYDATLKRPGCALLQVALTKTMGIADLFPVESWLLAPTPDLRVYRVDDNELRSLILISEMALHPRLESTAVILLRDHADLKPFSPESPQDRIDLKTLEHHEYVRTYLHGASAVVTEAGLERLHIEVEAMIRSLDIKGKTEEEIAEQVNKVKLRTRDGEVWSVTKIREFLRRNRRRGIRSEVSPFARPRTTTR